MSLEKLGWNSYFEAMWQDCKGGACLPDRVLCQQRGLWRVSGDFSERWATPSGKLRAEADEGAAIWPAVGDRVAVETAGGEERAIILHVLPRRSQFVRKAAGKRVE